jgi:ATP-binding cassette, subfamily C (CFTR/MRP), member 1
MTSLFSGETMHGYGSVPTTEPDDCPSVPAARNEMTLKNIYDFLIFGWFTPVLERMREQLAFGISPDLDDNSIPSLRPDDSSAVLLSIFKRIRKAEQAAAGGPSMTRCLWKALSPLFLRAGILKAVHDCLQFVGPQVLHGLIEFVRTPSENLTRGLVLTAVVTLSQMCMSLCLRHYFFMCYRVSLRVRTILLLAIYEKALTIDSSYYQNHPIGQVTNLMAVDTQRIQDVISSLHAVWYSFLQIALSMYFLWQQLGPSCLAGVLVIILSIPLSAVAAKWMGLLQKRLMVRKDNRVQTNQETITNMKVIKLQAWEEPFREKIVDLRRQEIQQLLIYSLGKAGTWLLWSGVPLMIALATFGAYVTVAGHILDVASALTALSLFDILRFPLYMVRLDNLYFCGARGIRSIAYPFSFV